MATYSSYADPVNILGTKPASGQLTGVGATAVALGSSTQFCSSVLIQNSNVNTGVLYVGDSNGQYTELTTGQMVTVPCSNLGQIYVRYPSGTANVNLIYMS